jgi:hypothetical protein
MVVCVLHRTPTSRSMSSRQIAIPVGLCHECQVAHAHELHAEPVPGGLDLINHPRSVPRVELVPEQRRAGTEHAPQRAAAGGQDARHQRVGLAGHQLVGSVRQFVQVDLRQVLLAAHDHAVAVAEGHARYLGQVAVSRRVPPQRHDGMICLAAYDHIDGAALLQDLRRLERRVHAAHYDCAAGMQFLDDLGDPHRPAGADDLAGDPVQPGGLPGDHFAEVGFADDPPSLAERDVQDMEVEDIRLDTCLHEDGGKLEQTVVRLGAEIVHQRGVAGDDAEVLVEHRVLVLGEDGPEQRRLEQRHVQFILAVHDFVDRTARYRYRHGYGS